MYQLYAEMNDEREILICEYPDPTFFDTILKNLTCGNYVKRWLIYKENELYKAIEPEKGKVRCLSNEGIHKKR